MKLRISNYTFSAASKTITFNGYTSLDLGGILLIMNATNNTLIYDFSDNTLNGTVAGNVLTLTYNTTAMLDTDKLTIFYEDPNRVPSTNDLLETVIEVLQSLSSAKGVAADLRVTPLVTPNMTTLSTVSTLNDQTRTGGYNTTNLVSNSQNMNAIMSNIINIG